MRYEGNIYRPPSEAWSLLIQVTVGCSHNKCTFCSMYKDKVFHLRKMEDVLEDIEMARKTYKSVEKIFICDGDAMCLSNEKLIIVLNKIKELFPECKRVGIYGSAKDILRKSDEELVELRKAGIGILYLGAESGNEEVLKAIKKGVTGEQLIESVKRCEAAGIKCSVTFISGMGGQKAWKEHAIDTGKMISKMNASYVSLLTLMLDQSAPIYDDIKNGDFELLSAEEVIAETYLLMQNANPTKPCVFRSNHASNYISLRGDLPQDKDRLLEQLKHAMEDNGLLKDERFRML
ncbi:MAG: radical SAM protein [Peptostreptococcaceae bacterium]|nr:radical SAM protein [Peptostreptococcaceae bacterium]